MALAAKRVQIMDSHLPMRDSEIYQKCKYVYVVKLGEAVMYLFEN